VNLVNLTIPTHDFLGHDSIASLGEVAQSSLDSLRELGLLSMSQFSSQSSGELSSLVQGLESLVGISSLGGSSSHLRVNGENASDTLSDLLNLSKLGTSTTRNLGDAELSEFTLQFTELLEEILLFLASELMSLNFDHLDLETLNELCRIREYSRKMAIYRANRTEQKFCTTVCDGLLRVSSMNIDFFDH
jgi:hypothetical protein